MAALVSGLLVLGLVPFLIFALILISVLAAPDRNRSSTPRPGSARTTTPARTVDTLWQLAPPDVRPELTGAEFVASLDGSFDQSYVTAAGERRLVLTGDESGRATVLHAVDPAGGKPLWRRDLDGALCATEAAPAGIVCASVLERDATTALGTRWRLHVLDPATGRDRVTRDIGGWLTAVHRSGDSFVVLEQRQPAPHAVLQAFRVDDLRPRWSLDLAREPGHASMFTENRIILRPEPERPGLVLDRPRFRDVGRGLLAVWAGMRTAVVDPDRGVLVMMPHCSRLVDDGTRLWCNEVDGATAYSYAGRKSVRVNGPRLAFPYEDPDGPDRSRAVFIDGNGAGVSVDPRTGRVGAAYTPPGRGSAFGMVTMPAAYTVGDRTFLIGAAGTLLLEPAADRVRWRNAEVKHSDLPVVLGREVLLDDDLVELTSGRTQGRVRISGHYTEAIGDQLLAISPEQIAAVRIR